MSLTAEESAALAQDELTEETQPEAPVSGEQSTEQTETPADEHAAGDGERQEETEGDGDGEGGKAKEPAQEQTPEQKRAWAQVAAAKKAQVQVAQARQKLEQDVARVRNYEAQLEQREQHVERQSQHLQQQLARLKPLQDALESRDLNALVALGFDYESFTREQISANTPEGIARRALEENKKLRERLEADKQAADDATKRQQQIAETRAIAHRLVELVDGGADEFPDLYVWAPERIAQEGLEIRDAHYRATRQMPTYGQVLLALQKRAKAEADVQAQRSTALQQRRSAKPSDAGSAGKVDPKGASGSPGTPALTSATANQRTTPPRQKTEEEIDAECLAELRGLRR